MELVGYPLARSPLCLQFCRLLIRRSKKKVPKAETFNHKTVFCASLAVIT